jgi:hypothetical protein
MSTWLLVFIAAVVVLPAPWLHVFSRKSPSFVSGLDGFTLIAVCGLVLLDLIPQAVHAIGVSAVLIAIGGFILPSLIERIDQRFHKGTHTWLAATGLLGLAVHSMLDGVALALPAIEHAGHHHHDVHGSESTIWAVLIHRLPMGLVLWGLVAPRFGAKIATAVLSLDAVGMMTGAALCSVLVPMADSTVLMGFQAFVGGSLLHILMHRHHRHGSAQHKRRMRNAELFGAVLGGVMLYYMVDLHTALSDSASGLAAFSHRLGDLWLESSPALLIGYTAAGILTLALPRIPQSWLNGGGTLGQSLRGVFFGLPLPICSCGVVPMYSAMAQRGIAPAAGLAFLVATPELGVESVLLGIPLLGGPLTIARLVAAAVVAITVGLVLGSMTPALKPSGTAQAIDDGDLSWMERIRRGLRFGFVEVVDDTAIWIVGGLLIAATVSPDALQGLVGQLPPGLDVVIFALVGLPIYVCASGATPLAAALIFAGVSPGAALAFLLAGPATNVTTFAVLSKLHGQKLAILFAILAFGLAIGCGIAVNLIGVPALGISASTDAVSHTSPWPIAAAVVMGMAFAGALFRQGVRGFVEPLVAMGGHDHDHDSDCGHDHGDEPACCAHGPEDHGHDQGETIDHTLCCGVEPAPPVIRIVSGGKLRGVSLLKPRPPAGGANHK